MAAVMMVVVVFSKAIHIITITIHNSKMKMVLNHRHLHKPNATIISETIITRLGFEMFSLEDGWVDGWMGNGRMGGWLDGEWMDGWVDGWEPYVLRFS